MTRSPDHDAALEAELAALAPAAPSAGLRLRVAADIESAPAFRAAPGRWLAERLLWACGGAAAGAVAASLAFAVRPAADVATGPDAGAPPSAVASAGEPPDEVAEEAVAWADAGVQFLDDRTPARILRRVAVERHRPAGGAEYRVPREDVILLPVALH